MQPLYELTLPVPLYRSKFGKDVFSEDEASQILVDFCQVCKILPKSQGKFSDKTTNKEQKRGQSPTHPEVRPCFHIIILSMLSDNYTKLANIIPYASHKRPNLHGAKLQTNNSSSAETLRHRPNQCASGGLKVFQIGTYAVLTNMGIYWDISRYIMRYTTQKMIWGLPENVVYHEMHIFFAGNVMFTIDPTSNFCDQFFRQAHIELWRVGRTFLPNC